jgi:hypothetical protein
LSDAGFSRTQSSFSSASGWSSRPTTCSSAASLSNVRGSSKSPSHIGLFDDEEALACTRESRDSLCLIVDCTQVSRIRASGARRHNGETSQGLSSVRAAWGEQTPREVLDKP